MPAFQIVVCWKAHLAPSVVNRKAELHHSFPTAEYIGKRRFLNPADLVEEIELHLIRWKKRTCKRNVDGFQYFSEER